MAKELVMANLVGYDSHGVLRIPQYLDQVKQGKIVPGAKIEIVKETPTTAIVDGHLKFGQMVGFAIMSFRENRWGGLISQGIGTSMLQMGNIVKNPRIWIPPILTSAITGPLATCVFNLQMNGAAVSSGMGTCGLVGQIGVYTGWLNDVAAGSKAAVTAMDWVGLILISFILPGVLTWVFGLIARKIGWIKENDLKL